MASRVFDCLLCAKFQTPSYQLLLLHIRLVHSTKPGFSITCGLDGCQQSFTRMKTFSNLMYSFHLFSRTPPMFRPIANPGANDTITSSDSDDGFEFHGNSESGHTEPTPELQTEGFQQELKSYAATWILKTKEGQKLTQVAIKMPQH